MIRATFYCDIKNEGGEIIEEDFGFDKITFENKEELKKYIAKCNYVVGEPCGYWGDDVGIFKELICEE